MRTNNNADAPRQGERPRVCCHQRCDTTAQLEEPTLAENQHRKEKSEIQEGDLYVKDQIHIHPAGTVNAADGTGFCFFHRLYGRVRESHLCGICFLSC